MNKLWIFGDSFSEPFSKLSKIRNWKDSYLEWKGYIPKSYGEIVSEKFSLIHKNESLGGADNYTILDIVCHNLNKIQKNDIVIVGWSDTLRFRIASNENSFKTIRAGDLKNPLNKKELNHYIDLSDNTLEEILINRDNLVYINELNNYIQLLNHLFKENKIIHWSPFRLYKKGLNTTLKSDLFYESIKIETNNAIDDKHFSENGHLLLANQLIDIINQYDFYKKNNDTKSFL